MQYPDNNIEVPLEVTNFLINLFNKRKFDEIIQKIETPIKKYPNSTTLLNIRGSTNLELKKFNMAVKDFKSACDKNPKIPMDVIKTNKTTAPIKYVFIRLLILFQY